MSIRTHETQMRILTDDPRGAEPFLAECLVDRWSDGALASHDRELGSALGIERAFSTCARGRGEFWDTLTIVSEAPGSQFRALDRLLADGHALPGPTVAVAVSGRHFQGQRDRQWVGAPGNLQVSIVIPTDMHASHAGAGLSMLPAVATVDAVSAMTRGTVRPGIKWVNDVLIGEQKVGGALTGARLTGDRLDDVMWGIGINVAVLPTVDPTPFVPAVTCLHAVDGAEHVTLADLFWALLAAIENRFAELARDGAPALFAAYRADSLVLGRPVRVWDEADCRDGDPRRWGPPLADGVVTSIRDDLGLLLEGHSDVVHKGRLAVRDSVEWRSNVRGWADTIGVVHG